MSGKTDLEVNENTIKSAIKCKKNYSCLSGNINDLCKVEMSVGNKVHFITCKNERICNYRVPFGYSYVCTCPVRKELYNVYKL